VPLPSLPRPYRRVSAAAGARAARSARLATMARRRPGTRAGRAWMRRLLLRTPIVGRLLWRRRLTALRAEQEAWRRDAAEHDAAVARILDQAIRRPR